jgi:ATP-dependent protease ClpP protease subunit
MFVIDGPITHRTTRRLAKHVREHDGELFHVYLNTPGGCTRSAFAMFEILRAVSEEQKKVVVVQGVDEVFSAGLVIYLAADLRFATKHTRFLIHEVTLEEQRVMDAKTYKMTASDLEKETEILYNLLKSRSKLTSTMIKKRVKAAREGDWIFEVDDAERYGIVTHRGFALIPAPKQYIEVDANGNPLPPKPSAKAVKLPTK